MAINRWFVRAALMLCALGVVFVALKITGIVAWSWLLVLLPFVPIVLLVAGVILAFLAWSAGGCH